MNSSSVSASCPLFIRARGDIEALARIFVIGAGVLAVALSAVGLAPSLGVALPCIAAAGAGNGVLNVVPSALIMRRARSDERGRVAALVSGSASATQLVALAVGGVVTAAIGPRAVFVVAGAGGAAVALLLGRRVTAATRCPAGSDTMTRLPEPVS